MLTNDDCEILLDFLQQIMGCFYEAIEKIVPLHYYVSSYPCMCRVRASSAASGDCGASALSPQLPTSVSPGSLKVPPQFLLLISQQGGQSSWGVWERKRLQALLEGTEMGEDNKRRNRGMEEEVLISCVMKKGGEGSASGCIKEETK